MAGLAKVTLLGNVGGDPTMRYTPAGKAFTTFSLAVSRNYTTADGERKEETEWFAITCWNRLAEIASQFVSKGSRLYVEGRISSRTYDTAAGEKRFSLDVNANELQIISSKRDDEREPVAAARQPGTPEDLESIPW